MNKNLRLKLPVKILLAIVLAAGISKSPAQIASDDASAYTIWTNGMNLGSGFTPWILTQNNGNGNAAGFFIGSSGGIDVSNQSFGLYANIITGTANTAYAVAYRGFSSALAVSNVFKVKFQNTTIATGGYMGFLLRNNSITNFVDGPTIIQDAGTRFGFYFAGGNNDYYIHDAIGETDTGIPFNSGGLSLEFYLLDADHYLLLVKSADGSTTIASFSNLLLAGSGGSSITTFAGFNMFTASFQDAYFNSFQISSFTSVPPQILNVSPANTNNIYWPTANGVSFDVTSLFSTVSSNGISLTLNGVLQTGANWTVFNSGTSSNHVVLNSSVLQGNLVYTGTVVAVDFNGNHTTNNFTFNTWLTSAQNPNNIYIEADDYNYTFGGISGRWIDNFGVGVPQPNQEYGENDLLGSNTVDYLEFGTNPPNAYRTNDLPQVENSTDTMQIGTNVVPVDHNGFAAAGFPNFDLGYIQNGEWEDYTRHMSNFAYTVYARMAGFPAQGGSTTMLMERAATRTVNSTNQPRASMGTFVCPSTGGVQNYVFVPLTDFFSNPVQIRLPGTNTFRLTCLGPDGSYNLHYLILVPNTNTAVLHPYIASGFPYPNAGGVPPDQIISFTIANQLTNLVNTGSIQVFLNTSNVTSGISISNNGAGALVSYQAPGFLPGGTNTLQVIYSDGLISQTNQWQFNVPTLPVIPPAWAIPLNGSFSPGIAEQIAKAPDSSTNVDFPNTVARALAQLAGMLTNSQNGQLYTNSAAGPNGNGTYVETNTVNYDITGNPSGSFTFVTKTNFPYVPAAATNNYIALEANMYVLLTNGVYTFAVRSDDGFELTAGPTPASTNMILGSFDDPNGRSDAFPTTFQFIVQAYGLYPMRLIYDQGQFGGNIEFYSINRTNGVPTLINDPATPGSIKVYRLTSVIPIPLMIQQFGTNVVLTWSDSSFSLQSAPLVTGTYTNISSATSPYTNGISGSQKYYRLIH